MKERTVQTERLRQEVILLPESERLIVDLSALNNLTPASVLMAPKENAGGLTVKKRADGLIEIESRRDTVRIRSDTVCNHTAEFTEVKEERSRGRPWVMVLAVFLLICFFFRQRKG